MLPKLQVASSSLVARSIFSLTHFSRDPDDDNTAFNLAYRSAVEKQNLHLVAAIQKTPKLSCHPVLIVRDCGHDAPGPSGQKQSTGQGKRNDLIYFHLLF